MTAPHRLVGALGAACGVLLATAVLVLPDRIESDALSALGVVVFLLFPLFPLMGYDLATRGGSVPAIGPLGYGGSYLAASAGADLGCAAALAIGVAAVDGVPPAAFVYGAFALALAGPAAAGRLAAVWLLRTGRTRPGPLLGASLVCIVIGLVAISMVVAAGVTAADAAQ